MNVYVAMARRCAPEALKIQERLLALGITPVSTWAIEDNPVGKREARVSLDSSDQQLASSAAMLLVGSPADPELWIRVGQAIEVHIPIVWLAPPVVDMHRPGIRVVQTLDQGLELLASWLQRLKRGIPDEFARRSLWVMLQAQDARQIDEATASPSV